MNDSSPPPPQDEDHLEVSRRPSPSAAYAEFARLFAEYLNVIIIGLMFLTGTSLAAISHQFDESSFLFHFLRDVAIAVLVAVLIAVAYETSSRMRFEQMLMTSFLGAVVADWSRQDVWDALKSQFLEKKVIREHLRIGVRLLPNERVAHGQMLLKLRAPNRTSRHTANRCASRQATETLDACLLAAHAGCATCGSGAANLKFVRRPNATVQAFRATLRRSVRCERRCPDFAAKPDGLLKRTLGRHAAYLDACGHRLPAL